MKRHYEGLVDDYGSGSLPRRPMAVTRTAGSLASETPARSSVYTRKHSDVLLIPPLNPSLPPDIFPFPGQVTPCSPCIKPPFNYPFVERYSSLSKPPTRSSFLRQQPQISPDPHPGVGVRRVQGHNVTWTAMVDRSDILFFALFSDQTDAFFIQALPLLSPRILGCAASFPLHVCNLWIDPIQSWFCLIILFPSRFLTHPILCAFGLYPPKLGRYLRIVLHALDSLYDT